MVKFETIRGTEFSTLRIVGPDEDKVTTLTAYDPLYRGYATQWPILRSSNSDRNRSCFWSCKVSRSLDKGNFDYISSYWEWIEDMLIRCGAMLVEAYLIEAVQASLCVYDFSDEFLNAFCEHWCPSTNTLIIHLGELSISMWDLMDLGGLSVMGRLFDEVIPTTECLSRSIVLGMLRHPFDTMGVDAGLEEEVYYASFLSCWLCVFVLPNEPLDFIRAGVFKMAMANGYSVSLAPTVLSCTYRSLSQISLSDTPSIAPECFLAHYVFGWMGSYLHDQHIATNRLDGP
ncbi:hypothetical protein LIER_03694 [Lithospermum erythrorhizon]|uniref:Aminotransferase-like plant mobile domain-containing protein n=1 Tax=Lithospermum erythrorhizon TaxID=34254 RepID=A0AAV3NUH5_LITER